MMPSDLDVIQSPKQLELFVVDRVHPSASSAHVQSGSNKRETLNLLLKGDLDFHGENSSYASHDLHAFAAKFPPQLPLTFIRALTKPGDTVLDPMMGSGTTVVEALIENRRGIGVDIDPLALRLCRVKTVPQDVVKLGELGREVISKAHKFLQNETVIGQDLLSRFDQHTKEFIDYWFLPRTQHELMALLLAIEDVFDDSARDFLALTFSAIIITKSGGVSRARDLAHTRPHRVEAKVPKNALEQFAQRLRKNLASIAELDAASPSPILLRSSAESLPLADDSVDLIVTSPPYANAIDYMRAHKFSLVWFGESVADLSTLRAKYIGSERTGNMLHTLLTDKTEHIIDQLEERDVKKAKILRKYFVEMKSVFAEMYRVLHRDSAAIIVVGPSTMRGLDVQTHACLADIAASLGFDVIGVVPRSLDRNKRMMPARFGKKTASVIEQRMHEEYVIGLMKN